MNQYIEAYLTKSEARPDLFYQWADGKGITRYVHGCPCSTDWPQMLKTGMINYPNTEFSFHHDDPPYLDHQIVFKNSEAKKCWLTYQPYREKQNIETEVIAWAEAHGLYATVYDTSMGWHGYDTCLVVIEINDN